MEQKSKYPTMAVWARSLRENFNNLKKELKQSHISFYSTKVDVVNDKVFVIPLSNRLGIDYSKMSREYILEYISEKWDELGANRISELPMTLVATLPKDIANEVFTSKFGYKTITIHGKEFKIPKGNKTLAWRYMKLDDIIEFLAYNIAYDDMTMTSLPTFLKLRLGEVGIEKLKARVEELINIETEERLNQLKQILEHNTVDV